MIRASLLAPLLVAACAVGPRYRAPTPPEATAYAPAPVVLAAPGVPSQRLVATAVPRDWWRAFGSARLAALVEDALAHSPTIAAANATLAQLREQAKVQGGGLYPSLVLNPNIQRARESAELQPLVSSNALNYTVITAGAQVSFNPDVFGGVRRGRAQARALAEAARYQLAAARATLAGNVVTAAIQIASLDAQLAEQQRAIAAALRTVEIGRLQRAEGQISGADLAAFEAQLAAARVALPPLDRARATARDSLAVLTGHTPDHVLGNLPTLDAFTLPADMPVAVPSRLVETRPDVLAAAANLRAANAALGIATSARLPLFNLTANGGTASTTLARLFRSENIFWTLIGGVTAPLLDAGTLLHGQRAARAGVEVSRAQYRSAVLTGLQNVADALEVLAADARAVAAAQAARTAAVRSLSEATLQHREGQVSSLALLSAQANDATVASQVIQARAARLSDTASLFVAMGGGQ